MWLKSFKIGLAVQTQYRRVTDRHVALAKTALTHCVAREWSAKGPGSSSLPLCLTVFLFLFLCEVYMLAY